MYMAVLISWKQHWSTLKFTYLYHWSIYTLCLFTPFVYYTLCLQYKQINIHTLLALYIPVYREPIQIHFVKRNLTEYFVILHKSYIHLSNTKDIQLGIQ